MKQRLLIVLLAACVVSLGAVALGIFYITAQVCDTDCPDRSTVGYVLAIGGGVAFVVSLLTAIVRGTRPEDRRPT